MNGLATSALLIGLFLPFASGAGPAASTLPTAPEVSVGGPFVVTSLTPTRSGFRVEFNRPLDRSMLNLYDTEAGGLGPPDVMLRDGASRLVRGSLVVDADGGAVTFVKTGGPFQPGTYTVNLRSAADGVRDPDGRLLDGNGDGVDGGDFIQTFVVDASSAVVASVSDFARGPARSVQLGAGGRGIPITLSKGTGVSSAALRLRYDPALLQVTAALPGASLPGDATVTAELAQAGLASVNVTVPGGLGPGVIDLVTLVATVPDEAPYRALNLLTLESVVLNGGALDVIADDGLHVVAFLGDTTGNGAYSSMDAQRVLRVAVGLDSGFAAYPLVDPVLIADITGNQVISALDATRILQEVVGIDRSEIPTPPEITGFSPMHGIEGTPVVIQGRAFDLTSGHTVVRFNDVQAAVTSVSPTTIEAVVPAGASTGRIVVRTPSGKATSAADFVVDVPPPPPPPTITLPLGAGSTTVRGTGVPGASVQVFVNGVPRGAPATVDTHGQWVVSTLAPALAENDGVTVQQTVDGVSSSLSAAATVGPMLTQIAFVHADGECGDFATCAFNLRLMDPQNPAQQAALTAFPAGSSWGRQSGRRTPAGWRSRPASTQTIASSLSPASLPSR